MVRWHGFWLGVAFIYDGGWLGGGFVGVFFIIVFFLVAFFMIGLILLQEGKGGGLTGMSAGMDGVMGTKNPLRRMTAWLFVFFIMLTIAINMYFHKRGEASLPAGLEIPETTIPPITGTGAPLLPPDAGDLTVPDLPDTFPVSPEMPVAPSPESISTVVETNPA
ncbi:MAG: preprotein translocase subunit SecG, partial [Planctomycetota bacterium]|nr:preprotein translocase subunit SecG [Planctomycetota bacterium]